MKVLIIDDSPDALALAKARLAQEPFEILTADGPKTGLQAAHEHMPDLILLDVDMPGLSGFDVCRMLKADPDLCMVPVIFLTGLGEVQDKVKGLEIGAVDYVTKPFDAFELRARVNTALRTKHTQDLLVRHASMDIMTGLPNRRRCEEVLAAAMSEFWREGKAFGLIMLDIDRFKRVNDTHGHDVGDRIIRMVGRSCASICRPYDTLGRWGGEEFLGVMKVAAAHDLRDLAERMRSIVSETFLQQQGQTVAVTVSAGAAMALVNEGVDALLRRVDQALYASKAAGRNRVTLAEGASADV